MKENLQEGILAAHRLSSCERNVLDHHHHQDQDAQDDGPAGEAGRVEEDEVAGQLEGRQQWQVAIPVKIMIMMIIMVMSVMLIMMHYHDDEADDRDDDEDDNHHHDEDEDDNDAKAKYLCMVFGNPTKHA